MYPVFYVVVESSLALVGQIMLCRVLCHEFILSAGNVGNGL
jgi:hypothetical protein